MIRIEAVSKHFGGLKAVDKTTFEVKKGSITGLIGPQWRWQNHLVQHHRGTI